MSKSRMSLGCCLLLVAATVGFAIVSDTSTVAQDKPSTNGERLETQFAAAKRNYNDANAVWRQKISDRKQAIAAKNPALVRSLNAEIATIRPNYLMLRNEYVRLGAEIRAKKNQKSAAGKK